MAMNGSHCPSVSDISASRYPGPTLSRATQELSLAPGQAECTFQGTAPVPVESSMSQAATINLACTAPSNQSGTSMLVGLQVEGLNQTARIPFFPYDTVWLPGLEGAHPADHELSSCRIRAFQHRTWLGDMRARFRTSCECNERQTF